MLQWVLRRTVMHREGREHLFDSTYVLCPPCKGTWLPLPQTQTIILGGNENHSSSFLATLQEAQPQNCTCTSVGSPSSFLHLSVCFSFQIPFPPLHLSQPVKICLVHLRLPQETIFCTLIMPHAFAMFLNNLCSK